MKKEPDNSVLTAAPMPEAEALAIREILERITASAAFRSSRRYPDFLRYTVEHALVGETENIKERVLGVEVFGRDPDYDTNSDPVVRMTAAEVRKRLDQYYRVRGHEHEIRIEYPLGSYVPEFVWPRPDTPAELPRIQIELSAKRTHRSKGWLYSGLAFVVAAAVVWVMISRRESALDRFWAPIFDSKATVLLCIPDMSIIVGDLDQARAQNPAGSSPFNVLQQLPVGFQRDEVSFVDAFTVMNVASALTNRGRNFRLFHTEDATLDDLKEGPTVLIGGTNNPWINQVSSSLRFSLAKDGPLDYISDRDNPSSRQWGITWQNPTVDYAIVSRVFDTLTAQPVVIAAGVHRMGTEAAGECFSNPDCFAQAEKMTPGNWRNGDVQIILETQVVNQVPGQPKVLAAYFIH